MAVPASDGELVAGGGAIDALPPAERVALLLATLGWSVENAARQWRVRPEMIRRWRSGRSVVPGVVLGWVDALLGWWEAHPAPDGRQRRDQMQMRLRNAALAREAAKRGALGKPRRRGKRRRRAG